jgi:hypothetical protein
MMTHALDRLVASGFADTGERCNSVPGPAHAMRVARLVNREPADIRAFRIGAAPEVWAFLLAPGAGAARPYVERALLPF